jgi:hypothetical protein
VKRAFTRILFFALAVVAGCESRIEMPAPTELAERSEAIRASIGAVAEDIPDRQAQRIVPKLDSELERFSDKFGERSLETIQAVTEAGLLLISRYERYDLAEPYFERALRLNREVFGTDHRETGYALHDLAVVRSGNRNDPFASRVEPVIREAIAVRTAVLGPAHKETAASERTMAGMMFGSWRRTGGGDAKSPVLAEANRLARSALPKLEHTLGFSDAEVVELRYLEAEIALAMADFAAAEAMARHLMGKYRVPCNPPGSEMSARQLLAAALRGQARLEEADAVEGGAPPGECGPTG